MDRHDFSTWLATAAAEAGASSVACLRMDNPLLRQAINANDRLVNEWFEQGRHAEMDYLQRMRAVKSDPWTTFPFARSVIMISFSNLWGSSAARHPFPPPAADALVGYVSAYAREKDYHQTGREILATLKEKLETTARSEVSVDTGAVYERLLATVGGLGVIGGNGLLRVPGLGTRNFIGCLFVDEEWPEVIPVPQMVLDCHGCRACVEHCPTGAIYFDQPIDARKCISYLTIEKRDMLSLEEGAAVGDWIFGCDCCTAVCPPGLKSDRRIAVDLEWLLMSPAGEIRRTIKSNATAYAGVTRLRRNAVVALGNMGGERARELLDRVCASSGSELVRRQAELYCRDL